MKIFIRLENTILYSSALGILALKGYSVFIHPINQDEFYFLALIHDFMRGDLISPFQNFHVLLFSWVLLISSNEVTQLLFGRATMFFLFVASCTLTYLIGRKFLSCSVAVLSVIGYTSISYVTINSASFRSDSIAMFFFLLTLFMLINKSHSNFLLGLCGTLFAFALLLTVKSIIYFPTLIIVVYTNLRKISDKIKILKSFLIILLSFGISFGSGYFYLVSQLSDLEEPNGFLTRVGSKVLVQDLFPQFKFIKYTFVYDFMFWIFMVLGTFVVLFKLKKESDKNRNLILLSFLFPLFSLVFYRNSFPYFYVFILTPAVIVFGYGIDFLIHQFRNNPNWSNVLIILVCLLFCFNFLNNYSAILTSKKLIDQSNLLRSIHQIFPKPVPYIDGFSMVASFPKAGFFMSSWGMEDYLQKKRPIMKEILAKKEPVFILANVPHLNLARTHADALSDTGYSFFREDWNVLKSNYIPHWGLIYVAGKNFQLSNENKQLVFDIPIPGTYTVESDFGAYIDGKYFESDSSVFLNKGRHRLKAIKSPSVINLRWGDSLYKPSIEAGEELPFWGPFL